MKKNILLLLSLCLLLVTCVQAGSGISLADAIKQKLVTVDLKGKGGYTGPVIDLLVKNISSGPVTVKLEAGRKLHPDDAGMQDILVTYPLEIVVKVGEQRKGLVYGMCCISHNSPPSAGMNFKMGKMADSNLVKLANFIHSTKMHSSPDAQHAVWVFSDKKRVEGIDITDVSNKPLLNFVCKLAKIKEPNYSIEYEKEENLAFSEKACKVKGFFKCKIEKKGTIAMVLFDSAGKEISRDEFPGPSQLAECSFEYGFRVKGFDSGVYYGRVFLDGKQLSEVKLEL